MLTKPDKTNTIRCAFEFYTSLIYTWISVYYQQVPSLGHDRSLDALIHIRNSRVFNLSWISATTLYHSEHLWWRRVCNFFFFSHSPVFLFSIPPFLILPLLVDVLFLLLLLKAIAERSSSLWLLLAYTGGSIYCIDYLRLFLTNYPFFCWLE